jgi:hypothetical protein
VWNNKTIMNNLAACYFNVPHGGFVSMNTNASGSSNGSNWHCVDGAEKTFLFGSDVVPHSGESGGTEHPMARNDDEFFPVMTTPPGSQRGVEFVEALRGHVNLYRTGLFDEGWSTDGGILDQLEDLITNHKLAPIYLPGSGDHTSGTAMEATMEKLSTIPEFKEYIEELKRNFAIRAFWIRIKGGRGVHAWHPDSFTGDATHRFILSLGCTKKRMGFAHYTDVEHSRHALDEFMS